MIIRNVSQKIISIGKEVLMPGDYIHAGPELRDLPSIRAMTAHGSLAVDDSEERMAEIAEKARRDAHSEAQKQSAQKAGKEPAPEKAPAEGAAEGTGAARPEDAKDAAKKARKKKTETPEEPPLRPAQ